MVWSVFALERHKTERNSLKRDRIEVRPIQATKVEDAVACLQHIDTF